MKIYTEEEIDALVWEAYEDGYFEHHDNLWYEDHDDEGNLKKDTDSWENINAYVTEQRRIRNGR